MEEKHKRIKKTSIEQYQYMINFLGEHKLMLKGKLSPAESTKVGELWLQLTKDLNNLKGSTKPLQQWKRTFIEYKSKVKAKSRLIQNKLKGTGGGPAEAVLNDTENLCLNLIGRITTEGDPELQEIGLPDEGPSTSSNYELITLVVDDPDTCNVQKPEEDADTGLIDTEMTNSDTCSTQKIKEAPLIKDVHTPKKVITSRKSKATGTPTPKASTLQELTNTNEKICEALVVLSSAINDLSKSNDAIGSSYNNVATSNNNLATAINNLANSIKLVAEQKTKSPATE